MGGVWIGERTLGPEGLLDEMTDPSCGALVVFVGTGRETEGGRPIGSIRYEAYAGMARRILGKIARQIEEGTGARVRLWHRVGRVPVGAASVVVACAAPHRAEAFEAARSVVEALKREAPIWKVSFEREPEAVRSRR